jgi:hypothetical protein
MITDRAWTLRAVLAQLMPAAFHNTSQYTNNADIHGPARFNATEPPGACRASR